MAAKRLVRVHGLGLDERFRSMLDVFFTYSCSGEYKLTNDAADLVLVDLDALGARDAYAQYHQDNVRQPSILFSLDEQEYKTRGNVVLLHKPFTVRQLQSAFEIVNLRFLNRMPKSLIERDPGNASGDTAAAGIKPASGQGVVAEFKPRQPRSGVPAENNLPHGDAGRSDAFRAAFSLASHKEYVKINTLLPSIAAAGETDLEYEPKLYLQGELVAAFHKARKHKQNAVIRVAGGTLTIDPEQALVKVGIGKFQLREVSSFPLKNNQFRLSLAPASEQPVIGDGRSSIVSLRSLIWKSALYAGRGRVPGGTDLDALVQMSHWPNLTRLVLTPGAVRMSALWTTRPCSINGLTRQLGISVHDVASFYSAADALDLFNPEERRISPVEQDTPEEPRSDSILIRILKRLRA